MNTALTQAKMNGGTRWSVYQQSYMYTTTHTKCYVLYIWTRLVDN